MRMNLASDILAGNRLSEVVASLRRYQKQIMAEVPKLFYIIVVDEDTPKEGVGEEASLISFSFSYTRPVMQSLLQLMGCKTRHAFKISRRVFEIMKNEIPIKARDFDGNGSSWMDALRQFPEIEQDNLKGGNVEQERDHKMTVDEKDVFSESDKKLFHFYKKRTTVVVKREKFLDVVCSALAEYRYVGPNQRADLLVACRIRERKESVTVLLCGTSGCGKSTLSSLLASRLGITTVISTDSIRHMMRSFADEKENPLLWASTYHAGECLDPTAVAKAKAKKKDKQLVGALVNGQSFARESGIPLNTDVVQAECHGLHETLSKKQNKLDPYHKGKGFEENIVSETVGSKVMAIQGYKAQCEMVIDSLDRLITAWEERKESVVVEGVHLSLNFVMGLMKKHPSIIPFMIYIASEEKHMERFAVRAKYMTLDPAKNKYVKYIRNIRTIQDYLCTRADKHLVPKVNNTNVDRSVASIHATIFSCLRRREAGEHLYDQATNTVKVVEEEYRNQCVANSLSSKGMFKIIQRQGSFRRLMAIVNTDGSVAKAWPFDLVDNDGKPILHHGSHSRIGSPVYGPLQIGRAESVNLQFGNFGISSWPNDTGGTSRASSVDGSRADGNELPSCYTSCSNSPRHSDGPAKELTEELPVPGSDEEPDEAPAVDTEDELSDTGIKGTQQDEIEGSVDEESARSEEGYEDSGLYDDQDGGYWSDNPDSKQTVENWQKHRAEGLSLEAFPLGAGKQQNCSQDIDSFYMKGDLAFNSHMHSRPFLTDPSLHFEFYSRSHSLARSRKPRPITSHFHRVHSRSRSVPSFVKYTGVLNGVTLSGFSRQPRSQ